MVSHFEIHLRGSNVLSWPATRKEQNDVESESSQTSALDHYQSVRAVS